AIAELLGIRQPAVSRREQRIRDRFVTAGLPEPVAPGRLLITAATQLGNAGATQAHLATAHMELGSARTALSPIRPALQAIRSDAAAAAVVTTQVDQQLQKERASFFSYRQRMLFGGLIALALIAGVLM